MVWTRRELLRRSVVAAGGLGLTACARAVAGSPRPAANVPRSTTRRPAPQPVTMAVVQGKPYAFKDSSATELTGQTVEVARAVLKRVGVADVKFVLAEFSTIFPKLQAKGVDMAGGLYVDRSVCQGALWSIPDHVGLTALAVPPGNPKGLSTFADVLGKGATVTVMKDLPEQRYATKAGVPAARLKVLPSPVEMLRAVSAGQADCAAFNDIGLRTMIRDGLARLDVTTGFPLAGEPPIASAFAFRRDTKPALIEAFNAELTTLHSSGEWLELAQPFGFTKENLPPADLTTQRLCG